MIVVFAALAMALQAQRGSSTRFHVENVNGIDWLVGPDGRRTFSFGVCCVDRGEKQADAKNPGYQAANAYVSPAEWANDTLDRLQNWGFNTVGAWSDDANLLAPNRPNMLFTPILHIGSSAGAPWRDMWDPKVVALMDSVARDQIRSFHGDRRIVGYFSDNEMGWWNGAMWDWAFKAGPASRGHVVDLLQSRYKGEWKALCRDFDPDQVHSFVELRKKGRLFLRPGGHGMAAVQAWMRVVSDRYYSLCRQIIKRYDPGALYLGDRYISNFYPEVAESAGRYCDVVSTNLNADSDDGAFAPFYLPGLRAAAKRPLMITEYYVAAKENRSGNGNNSSGFPVVETQAERARVFARETATFVRSPYVIGAHWFQYYDEPGKGRGDGENYDMGLVDVANRPYEELTDAARQANPSQEHTLASTATIAAPAVAPEVPAGRLSDAGWWLNHGACMRAVPAFLPNTRSRQRYPAVEWKTRRGDLFVAQQKGRLYAAVYWNEDRFAEAFYRAGKVPRDEEAVLVLFDGTGWAFSLAPSMETPLNETSGQGPTRYIKAGKWGVRNFVVLELPEGFAGADMEATLFTRGRAYEMDWAGKFRLKANP